SPSPKPMPTPRLSARTFYGLILAGLLLGVAVAIGAALNYLNGDRRPDALRIWGDIVNTLVLAVAAMIGGTFGALGGLATAVILDRRVRRSSQKSAR
ncbi:MAG TPA: hypothetical protein VMZ71_11725, partial [Gemmataceae bacterium]|nr:hypothetical protein [Gemmataceae bacterium]